MKILCRIFLTLSLIVSVCLFAGFYRETEQDPALKAKSYDLNPEQKALIVERTCRIVRENYVFPEVGKEISELIYSRWENGAYSETHTMPELIKLLTVDVRSVCADQHLTFSPGYAVAVTREGMRLRRKHLIDTNYGFNRIERLPGNIGYLEITEFCSPDLAGEALTKAFASLEGSDALIIDLRGNTGGAEDLVTVMCGYFFDRATCMMSSIHATVAWMKHGLRKAKNQANSSTHRSTS